MHNVEPLVYEPEQILVIEEISEKITEELRNSTPQIFKIKGSAGTGKTTIVKAIIEKLLPLGKRIALVAPTYKALSVLEEKSQFTYKNKVKYSTLASLLKMGKVIVDYETSETAFTFTQATDTVALNDHDIIFIDESSMVTKGQYEKIIDLADIKAKVVVFIGDYKQLPPIGEKISPSLDEENDDFPDNSYLLTKIVRQGKNNPIIPLSNDLDLILKFEHNVNEDGEGYLFTTSKEAVVNNLTIGQGSSKIKFLAWSNAVVDKMNKEVREKLYGPNPDKIYPGETIIANGTSGEIKNNSEILVENIEVCFERITVCPEMLYMDNKHDSKLSKIKIKDVPFGTTVSKESPGLYNVNGNIVLQVACYSINNGRVKILMENSEKHFNGAVKLLKGLASMRKMAWGVALGFEEKFIKFKYGYALTVHKSQGSTFENVVVDIKNIKNNTSEYYQMLYTAITRASKKVIFYYNLEEEQEDEK